MYIHRGIGLTTYVQPDYKFLNSELEHYSKYFDHRRRYGTYCHQEIVRFLLFLFHNMIIAQYVQLKDERIQG